MTGLPVTAPGIVVRKVIIAHGDCVGLNAGRHIEIWIGDNLGLTAGMDQETRVAIPVDEIRA